MRQFWILSGETKENQETIYIPLKQLDYTDPTKYELIDIFEVDKNITDTTVIEQQQEQEDAAAEAFLTDDEASGNIGANDRLNFKFSVQSATDSNASKEEKLIFVKPFAKDVNVDKLAKRLEAKNTKSRDHWKSYAEQPRLVYSSIYERFTLFLPPSTSIETPNKEAWSLFGLENRALDLSDPEAFVLDENDVDFEQHVQDENHDNFGLQEYVGARQQQLRDDLMDMELAEEEEEAADEEEADEQRQQQQQGFQPLARSSTVDNEDEGDADSNASFKSVVNDETLLGGDDSGEEDEATPAKPVYRPRQKRANQSSFGFRNTSSVTRLWYGRQRKADNWTGLYTMDRSLLGMSQIRFQIKHLMPQKPMELSMPLAYPNDFTTVYQSFQHLLDQAWSRYNLPNTMLTLNDLGNKSFNFVSYINNDFSMLPVNVFLYLTPRTAEILGLSETLEFNIIPAKQLPTFFTQVTTRIIEQPTYSKPIDDEIHTSLFKKLPPTTSIMLTSSDTRNATLPDCTESFMLAYVTTDRKLVSTNEFTFRGKTNYLTVEMFNQQTSAYIRWKESGKTFKFVFRKLS